MPFRANHAGNRTNEYKQLQKKEINLVPLIKVKIVAIFYIFRGNSSVGEPNRLIERSSVRIPGMDYGFNFLMVYIYERLLIVPLLNSERKLMILVC